MFRLVAHPQNLLIDSGLSSVECWPSFAIVHDVGSAAQHVTRWRQNCRLDPAEEKQAEKAQQLGGISSRGTSLLNSFGDAYYFEGVGRAVKGGLW